MRDCGFSALHNALSASTRRARGQSYLCIREEKKKKKMKGSLTMHRIRASIIMLSRRSRAPWIRANPQTFLSTHRRQSVCARVWVRLVFVYVTCTCTYVVCTRYKLWIFNAQTNKKVRQRRKPSWNHTLPFFSFHYNCIRVHSRLLKRKKEERKSSLSFAYTYSRCTRDAFLCSVCDVIVEWGPSLGVVWFFWLRSAHI